MKVQVKKIHNKDGQETGAILIAIANKPITPLRKSNIEFHLKKYIFNKLYPNEDISLYSEINFDTASVFVIRNMNNLPDTTIDME